MMAPTIIARVALVVALGVVATACEDEAEDVDRSCESLASGEGCTWIGLPGEEGFNGDGLHRRKTRVAQPQDLLWLPDGTAWFTDFNNFLIRRVLEDDTIETMVGSLDPIFPGDGPLDGIPPGGANGSDWLLNHPTNMVLTPEGKILVVAWHNHKLLTVDPGDGHVQVMCGGGAGFAGDGGPAATGALFKQVNDATLDDAGNVYLVDQQNQRIRRIDPQGIIETIAGTGAVGHEGAGGPALDATFSWAAGSNPNPSGGIVHHQGKLYVSDTEADAIRVIDLASGQIDDLAGTGDNGSDGDGGPALQAKINAPRDLEIGPDGDLYFAETDAGRVRAVDLETGIIRTVVGTGELGIEAHDGVPATEMQLRRPFGISFDPEGNLYVMDSLNGRIVKVAK
ncbi:MAG: SMP-30/gluconolactonase/LRE family protein [Myxococcales bacterium]|nr:SMP-30/gluconolactonase/LRE family protein [Myxococcales bacterium]MCB9719061.1 SMP-30/gluconolactonase/LRE family protein [Myxococcales bacterium]